MGKKIVCLWLFMSFILSSVYCASDRQSLENKMSKYQEEIELTNKLLSETYSDKQKTSNYVSLLNRKIKLRNSIIAELHKEIEIIATQIEYNEKQIDLLKKEIASIKVEYANLIRYAQKNRNNYERLMYVLAADDFNQAYKRIIYFQQYSDYRKRQIHLLLSKQDTLTEIIKDNEITIAEKKKLLERQKVETEELIAEKGEKSSIIKSLGKKEKELLAELKKKKEAADKLKKEIQSIIELEAKKKKENKQYKLTPEQTLIGKNFADNKGHLIWPTERGIVTSKFGEHPHPVLKNITVVNNGIDISTNKNATVRAIFDGVVSKIIVIPGSNAAIIVRHGDYLSVYSNVVNVKVKPGQKVFAKQALGTVFTDIDSGQTILQLQIWNETKKLNPQYWLAKQ